MLTAWLRLCGIVLLACGVMLGQVQQSPAPGSEPAKPQQPAEAPGNPAPEQQPEKAAEAAAPKPRTAQTSRQEAWEMLHTASTSEKAGDRAAAVRVLGIMRNDPRALKLAEAALADEKPEVRKAAAMALGEMQSKASIARLYKTIDDEDPSVALAAAHALDLMHDDRAYDVYYEILTGERKASKGMIASQAEILKDPKKLAEIGVNEGIGFIPFASIPWEAYRVIKKDDKSPVRVAAAKVLAQDPDPASGKALENAAGDNSWLVRAAALESLAKRGDPRALSTVELYMSDEKDAVKYTAAAATLQLMAIQESKPVKKKRTGKLRSK